MRGRRRTWLVIGTTGYLVAALIIGLWPTPVDAGLRRQIAAALGILHADGLPGDAGYGALEFTANIVFFLPIGVLVALLLPRSRWWLAIVLGALLSGAIELSQLLLLPARYASWGDIASNTLGTAIGVLVVVLVRRGRTPRRSPTGAGVSPARRARPAAPSPAPDRSPVP